MNTQLLRKFLLKNRNCIIRYNLSYKARCVSVNSHVSINNDQQNLEISDAKCDANLDIQEEKSSWGDKIIYNTFLENYRPPRSWRQEANELWRKPMREAAFKFESYSKDSPIALKYFESSLESVDTNVASENFESENTEELQYPYKVYTSFDFDKNMQSDGFSSNRKTRLDEKVREDNEKQIEDTFSVEIQCGMPNPEIPASFVPCGGCGAHLHCQDTAIPGFMPAETFTAFREEELRGLICQRCFYLQNHNAALKVNIAPEMYPETLKQIKNHFAMVLLIVDVLDFPCSIWPNLVDIIGTKRPVLIVGNKIDLLPRDSRKYLDNVRASLENVIQETDLGRANIIGTELISATTGYGVENLITKIDQLWNMKGDIFIMGCTNVGKSSLYNMFLQSDLCKEQVADLIHRATISPWPGTTLKLLKFPILKARGWKKHLRYVRLRTEEHVNASDDELKLRELKKTRDPSYAVLTGKVGRTYIPRERLDAFEKPDNERLNDIFHVNPHSRNAPTRLKQVGQWNPDDPELIGKWCYDTPGAVGDNQMLDLFTLPELMKILPKDLIEPRSYYVKVGMTVFIGGIARFDYLEGLKPIRYTVFTSTSMPITVCETVHAEEIYENALGTPILCVPMGDANRLNQFPPLKSTEFELDGITHKESCADIVISSAGFVAVTIGVGKKGRLAVHTPGGKGVYCRQPSLLPYMVNLKGKRIRDTPAYARHRVYVPV